MIQRDPPPSRVVILIADGVRPDTLRDALDAGALPALSRLRAEGGLHTVSSVFPSVTGPAYTPFLLGLFPGTAGLPGIRWWDRPRTRAGWPDPARSYVGIGTRHVDGDLVPHRPTLFELVGNAMGALTPVGRGLTKDRRLGYSWAFGARTAWTHFRGDVNGWLAIDRAISADAAALIRRERPRLSCIAHQGIDKTSHAIGHQHPAVVNALRVVDETAARIRTDAESDGSWSQMHLWVVSDHGHSPVQHHDDLADVLASWGLGVRAHPWSFVGGRNAAVMVSGNAMSHVYLELGRPTRPFWPELAERWEPVAARLLDRLSVDLMLLPHAPDSIEVRAPSGRGRAMVRQMAEGIAYTPIDDGDPLGLGRPLLARSAAEAHEVCAATDYPDALVQIMQLGGAPRAGEIIVSAARGWDFRARYEPIPHVSSHGALHREHMEVPLLLSRPAARPPRRTTDVFPSALAALGIPIPDGLDGTSWQ